MLYTDREETEKILREGRRLNDMSDIEYIEEYIRPIMDKYDSSRKSGQYWEKLPDGSDNPYGKEFYDYLFAHKYTARVYICNPLLMLCFPPKAQF